MELNTHWSLHIIQKQYHDRETQVKECSRRMIKSEYGCKRMATIIKKCLGPVTYIIREHDRRCLIHIDHLLPGSGEIKEPEQNLAVTGRDLPSIRPVPVDSCDWDWQHNWHRIVQRESQQPKIQQIQQRPFDITYTFGSDSVDARFSMVQKWRNPEILRSAPKRLDL